MEEYKGYKSNADVVYSCQYYVVWTPKYKRKVLVDEVAQRLQEIIYLKTREIDAEVLELEVLPDRVHLLIEVAPQFGIHRAIKRIKGATSKILRNEFRWLRSRLPTLWSNSYFISTVGGAPLDIVERYIENQKWEPGK
jgi:putative transposase